MEHHQARVQAIETMAACCDAQLANKSLRAAQRNMLNSLSNHWSGLIVFVTSTQAPMDNNTAERRMRNPAMGRKNYYGSGCRWSGELAATMFSLFQTVLLCKLNPHHWLHRYLGACAAHGGQAPPSLAPFLPWEMSEERKHLLAKPMPMTADQCLVPQPPSVLFTGAQTQEALSIGKGALFDAAEKQQRRKYLIRPRRGFYVIAPPQFLAWGAPPPSWYIDSLMRYENRPYYVALLKAAELHGATHQAVMEFQVITDKRLPRIGASRSAIVFYYRKDMGVITSGLEDHKTDTDRMTISCLRHGAEQTAFSGARGRISLSSGRAMARLGRFSVVSGGFRGRGLVKPTSQHCG